MDDQIICPHCKKPIPLTQALSHQLQQKYNLQLQQDRKKLSVEFQRRILEERQKIQNETEVKMKQKIEKEMEMKLTDQKNEVSELRELNKQRQQQLLDTTKLLRQLRMEKEQKELEMEKRLMTAQEKIRADEEKRLAEEYNLKIMEKDKKLQDALRLVEDYKRKIEQGSQQLQGEVLELQIENTLKREFPFDEIKPVSKGMRGGDMVQTVKNSGGKVCGSIIWESKRTKAWSDGWITKLKDDQRQIKAEIAVIVSEVLPQQVKGFAMVDGVWVCGYDLISSLAFALRNNLIDMAMVRLSSVGKNEKMEILYKYLSGTEFKQRVEAIVEAFTLFQEDIEKEKRWFTAKWSKQEKNIRRVIDNTMGMHGDLQSIMGKALMEIKGMEVLPPVADEKKDGLF